jgi:hypothetical protein
MADKRRQIAIPEPPTVDPRSIGGQTNYDETPGITSPDGTGVDPVAGLESVPTYPVFERPDLTFEHRPIINPSNWTQGTKLINMRLDVGSVTPVEVLTPLMPDAQGFGRKSCSIFNNSGVVVFVSGSAETCSTVWGFPIAPNAVFILDREMSYSLWMIAASGAGNDVRLMIETGYLGYRVASKIVPVGPMGID